jgi:hypothetical protein
MQNAKCKMPRNAGHFCWVKFFPVRKILISAHKYRSVARVRAQKKEQQ